MTNCRIASIRQQRSPDCRLPPSADWRRPCETLLAQLDGTFLRTASAANLIDAAATIQRIAAGHIAGLPIREDDTARPEVDLFVTQPALLNPRPFVEVALRGLDGLRGSDDNSDVVALTDLTAMIRGDHK